MPNKEQAQAAKTRGNNAFTKGDFETAVKEFTSAIQADPTDHVFYSNRSGAYASLKKYEEALKDANECIKIKPDWAKGYSRKGLAALALKQYKEARAAYEAGLKLEPSNAQCKEGLSDVERAEKPNPMASIFGDSMWAKLAADPVTREYLNDPTFVQKLKMMQTNPNMFGSMAGDPKLSAALGVLLGLGSQGFSNMNPGAAGEAGEDEDVPMRQAPAAKPAAKKAPEPEPEEEEEEVDAELMAEKALKKEAAAEKDKGNEFYKKKQFAEAHACYDKAIEKDPSNLSFKTNKAAAFFEEKKYEECAELCKKALAEATTAKGYDYKMVAKAWCRLGNALDKLDKVDEAMDAYKKALLEDPLPAAKTALAKLEAKAKILAEQAYLNPEKAEEHRNKGNDHFKNGKWIEAIEEYSEAVRRNPKDHRIYSNRAACYTKLMDWNRGLEDCDKCLELDPKFVKAYIRKGKIQHFLKQYHKALETYQKGFELDPTASELIEGKRQTMQAINMENSSGNVDPARAKEAMKDPEIQAILQDPMINKVLKDMQTDPEQGQRALNDPNIRTKIEKLIAAGILQVGSR